MNAQGKLVSENMWYYVQANEQRGPVSEGELGALISRGEIGSESLVWREGMQNWDAAKTVLPGAFVTQSAVDTSPPSMPQPSMPQGGPQAWLNQNVGDLAAAHLGGHSTQQHPTNFVDVVRTVFSRYVQFSGRARRSEYWYWFLFIVIGSFVTGLIDAFLISRFLRGAGVLSPIFSLAILLPTLGVGFRRMHDIGRSAWWLLISIVPVIGPILFVYWFVQPGEDKDNKYGPA